jgi:hypothetical protein
MVKPVRYSKPYQEFFMDKLDFIKENNKSKTIKEYKRSPKFVRFFESESNNTTNKYSIEELKDKIFIKFK